MCDSGLLLERLRTLLEALERIPRRFAGIITPSAFHASDEGIDRVCRSPGLSRRVNYTLGDYDPRDIMALSSLDSITGIVAD